MCRNRKRYEACLNEHAHIVGQLKDVLPIKEVLSNDKFENIKSNSWFNIRSKNFKQTDMIECKPTQLDHVNEIIRCKKVIILPTNNQRELIFNWFEGYRKIYNDTVKLIRHEFRFGVEELIIDWKTLRTIFMEDRKHKYMEGLKVPSHVLDSAIKSVCSSYKSALTNLKLGNIKHFVIRYIKKSKKDKVLGLEKIIFNTNGFYTNFLGKMRTNRPFDFKTVKGDPILHYDSSQNRFTLLIPEKIKTINNNNDESYVGLDGGVRTFLTGISNKNAIEIGTNLKEVIKSDFRKLDKINNNPKIPKKIKKKYEKRINKRTKNRITDLHWKSINYLTNNYDSVIIGKLSTKSIVNKETSVLDPMTKRVAMKMSFYQFLERLKYKCQSKNISLQIVDEYLTSKLCPICSTYNNVEGSKIYKCSFCNIKIDRDIVGSLNISMRGFNIK